MMVEIGFTTQTIDTIESIINDYLEWSTNDISNVDELFESFREYLDETNCNPEFNLDTVIKYYNMMI